MSPSSRDTQKLLVQVRKYLTELNPADALVGCKVGQPRNNGTRDATALEKRPGGSGLSEVIRLKALLDLMGKCESLGNGSCQQAEWVPELCSLVEKPPPKFQVSLLMWSACDNARSNEDTVDSWVSMIIPCDADAGHGDSVFLFVLFVLAEAA